ncbi:MAG: RNA 3'-terminal phosphate cyclase [Deltaproteobacteria bacterium]|nr:RNA 3'-terminal phosphate cyclase [Deltaproteobacteria bacterium]
MLEIDGSMGEGGGQVLRTALALSLVTGTPFRAKNIRAGRPRPGLMRQHLAAVLAAQRVGAAHVEGAEQGSRALSFQPATVVGGHHSFRVGTAGSATLVLQAVLPALLLHHAPTSLDLEGGTHNPLAPPFDFLERAFLPLLCRMGPRVDVSLSAWGFFPAGGGRFHVDITPARTLRGFSLLERGAVRDRRARILLSRLPGHVGDREADVVRAGLGLRPDQVRVEDITASPGPGNAIVIELVSEHVTEVFTAFGEKRTRAEEVAARVVEEVNGYLAAGLPVGEHLADQLLLPLALAGEGEFATATLSGHARTQLELIPRFLPVTFHVDTMAAGLRVRVGRP